MELEEKKADTSRQEGAAETVTMTQEELDARIQKEADRRVTQAMKTAEKKSADKIREAQKLASMSAQEQYEYQLQQREAAIAEKERQLALAENKNEAGKVLAEKGLSLTLVDLVLAEDAETMMGNIKVLEKAFKASVKAEVERRLGTDIPKKNLPPDEALTRERFAKMSLAEQAQLLRENPELYETLTK